MGERPPIHQPSQPEPPTPTLEAKVAFLKRPEAYPERPAEVQAVETHMSWVFLAGDHAYKLKKPVRHAYLDFSTIEARRVDCEAEIRLNRRLAPAVYLDTIALTYGSKDGLGLSGSGKIVDWLVKMRRLPAERMLDSLIRSEAVTRAEILQLGSRLASFYASAVRYTIAPAAYRQTLAQRIADNLRELAAPEFGLDQRALERLRSSQLGFIANCSALLDRRVTEGRIVEGHGDLRPEHVCLLAEPVVIDCLEFNQEFRILDPADELGYLALECERLHAGDVGRWLLEGYTEASGDATSAALLHFYQSCRGVLRAKLAAWHLRDDGRREPERWLATAGEYLELARRHADQAAC